MIFDNSYLKAMPSYLCSHVLQDTDSWLLQQINYVQGILCYQPTKFKKKQSETNYLKNKLSNLSV